MGRYTGKQCRLLTMICLTGSYFLVEIVVGYVTNSLALVSDSYHMLSDVIALIIGFASVKISKMASKNNTFGWVRAEVVGALINAVFLLALCFTIFVEGLQRLAVTETIDNPKLLLIVGSTGLFINIIGLFLFGGGHGHSHGGGGHGHSHGGDDGHPEDHGHSHGEEHGHSHSIEDITEESEHKNNDKLKIRNGKKTDGKDAKDKGKIKDGAHAITMPTNDDVTEDNDQKKNKKKKAVKSSSQLNMRGVFLHVLGDALGSVVVIISAIVIWKVEGNWKYKLDPLMSIIIVFIIIWSTVPLFKESALILLQTVPTSIEVQELKKKLVTQFDEVVGVHEFHIWQLAGSRIVASVHVQCKNVENYNEMSGKLKAFFHNNGIHSTTIQAEFPTAYGDRLCILECGPDQDCYGNTCCAGLEPKGIPQINEYDNINFRASHTSIESAIVPMHDRKIHDDPNILERTPL